MPQYDARLLGAPQLLHRGRPIEIRSAKARGLLWYLVATRQVHSRDRLASFFWPEVPERKALASLRTGLYDVRRGFGKLGSDVLMVDRTRVAFSADAELDLDVAVVEALSSEGGAPGADALRAAVDAYRGPFLDGVSLPDAFDFDDWVFLERERLANIYVGALCRLAALSAAEDELEGAIDMARRVLTEDGLREDVHRDLMRFYARAGQRAAALAQYQTCAALLDRELGIAPLGATTELRDRIAANEAFDDDAGGPGPVARAAAARLSIPTVDPLAALDDGSRLVGRDDELATLAGAWSRARDGSGSLVLLAGEAGIGKTRLVGELVKRAEDAVVLFGRCYQASSNQPYGPVTEALRRALPDLDVGALGLPEVWLRELTRVLPELEALLPAGRNAPLDGVRDRDRLFEGVRAFLSALSADRPLLLVIEDAQWSDETSLSLLGYITRHVAMARVLVVVTFRREELGGGRRAQLRSLSDQGSVLSLAPLSSADTARLVGRLSGSEAPPERFGRRLREKTGGNPFFVIETLRALFELGTLQIDEDGWSTSATALEDDYASLPIPASVGTLVDGRLERLGDDARSLLECAAALRRDFAFDVVQAASGVPAPAALDALDDLLGAGLLREVADGDELARYDFVHALVRDRVYGAVSGARRQHLHRQIAGLVESRLPVEPERVAFHYTRGGVRDRAVAWSLRAAEAALGVYAGEDALAHFRAAIELAVSPTEEHAALAGMGDAHVQLGRPARAIERYRAALTSAPDDDGRSELHRRIGRAFERQGAYDRALDAYRMARGELAGRRSMAWLRLNDGEATVYVRLGRHAEARALCGEALAWLDENEGLDGEREAEAWLRNTLGMAHLHDGAYEAAVEHLEASQALKRELGDRLGEATLLNNLGVVYYHCGDDGRARDFYSRSLALKEEIGDGYGRAIALTNLALIETHVQDFEAAAAHLHEAEATAGDVGATWLLPEIKRVAAQRALALGDHEAAISAADASLSAAEELGVPAFIGVAHRVMGSVMAAVLDDTRAADEHFQTSLAVFEMLENEHELAKTHAAYGEVLAALGRGDDADEHLRVAFETFSRSGAYGRRRRLEPLLSD